jgi:hypothetical protein
MALMQLSKNLKLFLPRIPTTTVEFLRGLAG